MEANITLNASFVPGAPFGDVTAILTAAVLGILILATVVGNVFVIAAIVLERNLQSVANYLIVSLAVADLMVACLVMPLGAVYEINSGWSLGPELCDMWTSSDVLCCTASILHLVAIAVDRYWAVTDLNYIQIFATCATFYLPLLVILFLYWKIFQAARRRIRKRPGTTIQPPRERRGILRLVKKRPREESTAFTITRSTPDHSSVSPEKSSYNGANIQQQSSTTVALTTTTTTTTTMTTLATTSSETTPVPTTTTTTTTITTSSTRKTRETIEAKRERKAAKTLAIITGAFVACWLPFFLVTLLQTFFTSLQLPPVVYSFFLWLGYFNSTLNPVIYTIFSPEFRQAFKRILCGGARFVR
ncbi:5-hydroxytryptamine receptor 2B-like isoform X2 [Leptopilina heterotoma]|uniref:5-hydroxytryptamine receptor 2B-like isoform X2 n=1 Tax=Leptopilina heterotoma TaxID=63436 RepID=UPI001CA9AE84|nr:5-hydroxytryptamine receptor 2B-like isoform X2 [Leptopilina heterotoma]